MFNVRKIIPKKQVGKKPEKTKSHGASKRRINLQKMLQWKLSLSARLEGLAGSLSASPYKTLADNDFRRRRKREVPQKY